MKTVNVREEIEKEIGPIRTGMVLCALGAIITLFLLLQGGAFLIPYLAVVGKAVFYLGITIGVITLLARGSSESGEFCDGGLESFCDDYSDAGIGY